MITRSESLAKIAKPAQRGLLTRQAQTGMQGAPAWRYTPRFTRQQQLCAAIAQLCAELDAGEVDRQFAAMELRRGWMQSSSGAPTVAGV